MSRALAGVFARLSLQVARIGRLAGYAAAGALSRAELQARLEAAWDEYGDRHALSSHGAHGLSDWEKDFYLKHLRAGQRVLLVGCGTGRDLIALAAHGLQVDGLDVARRAIAICRERLRALGMQAELFDCAVEDARFGHGYDAVVWTWLAYGYIAESRRRVRTLAALRSALAADGRVLYTYQPRGGRSSRIPISLAGLVGALTASDWRIEPGDSVEISAPRHDPTIHFEHRFTPDEVLAEAQAAGLRVVSHEQAAEGRVVLVRA